MKNVAVICAFPALLNPGMLSVDLAFISVQEAIGKEFAFTFFCAEEEFKVSNDQYSMSYELLSDQSQLLNFDLIIYWGDFLHWIGYAKNDWMKRSTFRYPSHGQNYLLDLWYKLFLLEGATNLQTKAIVFGGTLYCLDASQLTDDRYLFALTSLYQNSRLVLLRDELSACLLSQLIPSLNDSFGCDCSLLMNKMLEVSPNSIPKERYAVCSFGRSSAQSAIGSFANQISHDMGLKLLQIDWLGMPSGLDGLRNKLALVRGAELVITDIYHLSVSSWREGVPAACIGKGSGNPTSTLSDKKKEIFYRQMFGSGMYFYLEDLFDAMRSDLAFVSYCKVCEASITNIPQRTFILSALKRQCEKSFARLLSAIREVPSKAT